MCFKKFFKKYIKKSLTATKEPLNTEKEVLEATPVSESSNEAEDQLLFGSSSLFGKMRNRYSGPDMLYENEAWAPENVYVGLFRKRRIQYEEQASEE